MFSLHCSLICTFHAFSEFEREEFRATCRDYSKINAIIENELPDDLLAFLKSENHLKRVKDYCIFQRLPKVNMAENIIVTYLMDSSQNIYDILSKWEEFLSPPVRTLTFDFYLLNS